MRRQIPTTPGNVRDALRHVSPSCDRATWFRVLAAIKDALGEDGREIADSWSQEGDSYSKTDFRDAWKSAKPGGKVTVATLWRTALDNGWKPDTEAHQETEAERLERERKRKARAEQAEKQEAEAAKKAAAKASALWKASAPAIPDHPYLARKLPGTIPPSTLRETTAEQAASILGYPPKSDGEPLAGRVLVVPVKIDGKLSTAELIDEQGCKTTIAGGLKSGGLWAAQSFPKGDGDGLTLAFGEGVGTVLSCREATKWPVFAALSSSNLPKVAEFLRNLYPKARLLALGDVGNGLKDAERAAKVAGAALAVPEFTPEEIEAFQHQHGKPPKDWNDLHVLAGLGAVAAQLGAAGDMGAVPQASGQPPDGHQGTTAAPVSPPAMDARRTGPVVDLIAEYAALQAYQTRIEEAGGDPGQLIYVLAPEIQASILRKATQTRLLKIIARKTDTNLESLRELVPGGGGDGPGRGRADPKFLPYRVIGHQLFLIDEQGQRPLCNFVATITEEVIYDNGLEEDCLFRIEGRLSDGTALPAIEVAASKYAGLSWVTAQWGARALVHAGNSIKDHLRTAIQGLSKDFGRRTVYGHTGWRLIDGRWGFLHGGGAISADGHRADIEVRAGEGNMRRYGFEAGGGDLVEVVRASLRLLDLAPNNLALGVALLAAVYRAPLGEAATIDHGLFLAGQTGSRKSEAAGVALAHFGRGFDARHFPANWDDSESDLEAKGHGAKDCLFVVDDFKPRGASSDVHKLHVKADRLIRAVGNQSGRGRRTSDMKQRAAFHPRGLVLATGEDIPRGASLRARMAVVELSLSDIDNTVLSELQESARVGRLETAMAGYLAWLAPIMDEHKTSLPAQLRAIRDRANTEGFTHSHPRAADIYASFIIGLDLFLDFAVHVGAADRAACASLFERCETTLKAMVSAQGDFQADQDEVAQFFGFLRSALNAGYCHFSDSLHQGAPAEHPSFWGWRVIPSTDEGVPAIEKPQGERVGWVDSTRVLLDGNAAFAAVQELAKATGENLPITQRTLWKRIHERGLLLDVQKEGGKLRLTPKRTIAGVSRRVYVMTRRTIEDLSV
ncbi:Primase C terminal 2 (PriCT-2) [Methylomagnum ishizawai]|uniref:Primase C terminal 2 (PriCT-2) n=1 Tax=Methylomagnum ishizawai TaxID=1760988 RepID=A0A1Y6CYW9_9GAMM|nr:PriCT-2 domain-containing protein [Methylomagnum ishizawai]SMF95869.1 Primase C terminal 2 (PriCT-2) [Methylomagnum ishizawai]